MGGKGSGGYRKNAYTPASDKNLIVDPGDNALYLQNSLEIMRLPKITLDDPEVVQNRIDEYFAIRFRQDMKPTVSSLAMALGISRKDLWCLVNDQPWNGQGWKPKLKPEVSNAVKNAYRIMETLWEDYMQNGKINPVSGIFLGKNNYGYRDSQEVVLTPNAQRDAERDPEELNQKYLESVVVDEEV